MQMAMEESQKQAAELGFKRASVGMIGVCGSLTTTGVDWMGYTAFAHMSPRVDWLPSSGHYLGCTYIAIIIVTDHGSGST